MAEGEIQRPLLIISDEKVPTAAYQAIYHRLTSKVEKISETFSDCYDLKVEDLTHLHNLIEQAINQFGVQGRKNEITVSLRKGESHTFSDFSKFVVFNFSSLCATQKIVYEFDFFTTLPVEIKEAQDIVQRFKITVAIDQDFVEDEDQIPAYIFTRFTGDNVNLSIEYADYSVARNVQGVVRDWVESLPVTKKTSATKFWTSNSDFINFLLPRALPFAVLLGAALNTNMYIINDLQSVMRNLFIVFAFAIMAQIMGHVFVVEFYKAFNASRPLTYIQLTEGDRRRYIRQSAKRAKRAKVMGVIFVAVIIGFAVSLLSSYVFTRYFGGVPGPQVGSNL